MLLNRKLYIFTSIIVVLAIFTFYGCSKSDRTSKDEGEEESSNEFALDETYDKVRKGARLILSYNKESNSFIGTVENTTDETLKQIRVEVHLSNGKEIGPTLSTDLKPGEKIDVQLKATSNDFEKWTAHPEVGSSEHSDSEHGDSENDREVNEELDREGNNKPGSEGEKDHE